jgi:hypothetical protein
MNIPRIKFIFVIAGLLCALASSPGMLRAQDEAPMPSAMDDTTTVTAPKDTTKGYPSVQKGYENLTAGEFTPAQGFDIFKSDIVSFNLSFYGLFRYINQMPGDQSFTDHLGNIRTVGTRNDFEWQRSFIWLTGFFYDKRFRYNVSVWSLGSTQQTLIFGQLMYRFGKGFTLGGGIGPNLGIRSLQGTWPFWLASDRSMGEEVLRPGFSATVYGTGEVLPRFYYKAALCNNLSQLGVKSNQLTRDLTYGASFWWMPTTGEYGPRGGWGDLEDHQELATRFGISSTYARDDRLNPVSESSPLNTQVRLTDGVLLYETGALAPGVTVQKSDFFILSGDAGFKLHGWNFQAEFFYRKLSNFLATGPVPENKIEDKAIMFGITYMFIPKYLEIHGGGSYVFDEWNRKPWEIQAGASYYPSGTRSWRVNLHVIRVEKSPTGSTFGFYTAGQTGTTVSVGSDLLL